MRSRTSRATETGLALPSAYARRNDAKSRLMGIFRPKTWMDLADARDPPFGLSAIARNLRRTKQHRLRKKCGLLGRLNSEQSRSESHRDCMPVAVSCRRTLGRGDEAARLSQNHDGGSRGDGHGGLYPSVPRAGAQGHAADAVGKRPNNHDIMGVGTNGRDTRRRGIRMTGWWTFGSRKTTTATTITITRSRARTRRGPGPGRHVRHLQAARDATFHDGTPVTAKDVKWSFDRAVTVGRLPDLPDEGGLPGKGRTVRRRRRPHIPHRFRTQDKLTMPDTVCPGAGRHQLGTRQEARHGKRPVGDGMVEDQRSRRGRLSHREMDARTGGDLPAFRPVEIRAAAEGAARQLRMGAVGRNRRALLERGDADISFDLPPKDVSELANEKKLT